MDQVREEYYTHARTPTSHHFSREEGGKPMFPMIRTGSEHNLGMGQTNNLSSFHNSQVSQSSLMNQQPV